MWYLNLLVLAPPGHENARRNALSAEDVLREIEAALGEAVSAPRFEIETIPPFYCDPGRPIVRLASKITGRAPQQVGYYTDGAVYKTLMDEGRLKDGMLVLGCGDIRYAHAPDERIGGSEIVEGIALFKRLIAEYCCR